MVIVHHAQGLAVTPGLEMRGGSPWCSRESRFSILLGRGGFVDVDLVAGSLASGQSRRSGRRTLQSARNPALQSAYQSSSDHKVAARCS